MERHNQVEEVLDPGEERSFYYLIRDRFSFLSSAAPLEDCTLLAPITGIVLPDEVVAAARRRKLTTSADIKLRLLGMHEPFHSAFFEKVTFTAKSLEMDAAIAFEDAIAFRKRWTKTSTPQGKAPDADKKVPR